MRRILVLVALLAMAGCQPNGEPSTTSPTWPASEAPTGVGDARICVVPGSGPVEAGSVLVPGPINGLPASDAVGEKLTLTATVLEPGCGPASGAEIRVWHTDAKGLYGPAQGDCCYYGGTVTTDSNGRFKLDTIRPAQYPYPGAPPAHIHFEIRHTSGELDTEILFRSGSPPAGPIGPAHAVPVVLSKSGNEWQGETAFVLMP
jgi:protocatechuate 3,4-dioxygenase beta subunit